ncbi:hypothetical protein EDD85DRAFT_171542 [Armillaria nabsnona]|nr:hypothetical protein EDD85DRAFT_171542 [Armillaria nabsnona]
METINAADGNNSFTHCASTTLNVTSSSQPQSMSHLESTSPPESTPLPQSTSFPLSSTISRTESTAASATSASTSPHSSKSLTAGAIAGIVVGSIAFVGAITLFLIWLCSYRRRQTDVEDSETLPTPFTIGHTPSMSNSSGTPILTSNPESGAGRRLRMKEQRELPPRYAE